MPTPASIAPASPGLRATPAADAAAKMAAHEPIVVGFEAVAASEVRKARRGLRTSASISPPARTRNADQSVRSPSTAMTAAPTIPSTGRRPLWASTGPAPAIPSAA